MNTRLGIIALMLLLVGCDRATVRPSNDVTLTGNLKYNIAKETILDRQADSNVEIYEVIGDSEGPFREPQQWVSANHVIYFDSKGQHKYLMPKDSVEYYFQADHYQDRQGEPLIVIKKIPKQK